MKIFIDHQRSSCALNYQPDYIYYELSEKFDLTENISEADVIVLSGGYCSHTSVNIVSSCSRILSILEQKNKNAKVYLTGCITRVLNKQVLSPKIENFLKEKIDVIVPYDKPNLLLKLVSQDLFKNIDSNDFGMAIITDGYPVIYISNGCLNNCSFCKVTFQDFPVKSMKLEKLKSLIDLLDEKQYNTIYLKGTNICQYGIDLYQESKLPELIEHIEAKQNIKNIYYAGFAFKDAIENNFLEPLSKTKKNIILGGSLESGSDRILKLQRKGFTTEQIIHFVAELKKANNINFSFDMIVGFPTETLYDVKQTLEVLKELAPHDISLCRYDYCNFTDSSKYEQLSPEQIQEHARIYDKVLQKRKVPHQIVGTGYKYNNIW